MIEWVGSAIDCELCKGIEYDDLEPELLIEKLEIYLDFSRKLQDFSNMNVTVVTIITWALGTHCKEVWSIGNRNCCHLISSVYYNAWELKKWDKEQRGINWKDATNVWAEF